MNKILEPTIKKRLIKKCNMRYGKKNVMGSLCLLVPQITQLGDIVQWVRNLVGGCFWVKLLGDSRFNPNNRQNY